MRQTIEKRIENLEAQKPVDGPEFTLIRVHHNAEWLDPTTTKDHERPGTDEYSVNRAGVSRVIQKAEFDRLTPGARFVVTRLVLAPRPNAEPLDDLSEAGGMGA
jgi:hypothetical protein